MVDIQDTMQGLVVWGDCSHFSKASIDFILPMALTASSGQGNECLLMVLARAPEAGTPEVPVLQPNRFILETGEVFLSHCGRRAAMTKTASTSTVLLSKASWTHPSNK